MTTKDLSFKVLEQIPLEYIECFLEQINSVKSDRDPVVLEIKKKPQIDKSKILAKFHKTLQKPPRRS